MKQERKDLQPGWGAALILLAVVVMFLGVESKAADVEDVAPELRAQPLGRGSLIEVNDDMDFSLSREKRYCDGQDAGFFRNLMSTDCCVIRIQAVVSDKAQIVLKRGLRAVSEGARPESIQLEAKYPTSISCGDKAPTVTSLERAFGNRIRIQKVVAGLLPQAIQAVKTVASNLAGVNDVETTGTPSSVPDAAVASLESGSMPIAPPEASVKAGFDDTSFRVDEI